MRDWMTKDGEDWSKTNVSDWKTMNMFAWRRLLEFILEVRGEGERDRRFVDDIVEIHLHGQSGGVEVIRVSNRNPVLIFNAKGDIVRTHSEFRFVRDRISNLARDTIGEPS